MSKYLNPTAIITGIIAAAILLFAYNRLPIVKKVLGGQ